MQPAALLSVSDRTGLPEFARGLSELGLVLLGTKGTKTFLEGHGVKVESIEEYTGQNEILDGRVKTLHPKIHAGLLAKRDNPQHMAELKQNNIYEIKVAAINLYPFSAGLKTEKASNLAEMVELIDIGGPTMIRAAAKNFKSIYAVIDPADYGAVLSALSTQDQNSQFDYRKQLATKVFTQLANYNLEIARYLSADQTSDESSAFAPVTGLVLERAQELRYGENPHQAGAFYRELGQTSSNWKQLQGKELSYNNFLDFDAAFRIVNSLGTKPAVVIVKHLNPCGAAIADTLVSALHKAKAGDPRSHFGGIVACNQRVDQDLAQSITQDFAEIVVAPDFSPEALEVFASKKNLRVISISSAVNSRFEYRSVVGGMLIQVPDKVVSSVKEAKLVSKRKVTENELQNLQLAWNLCAHIKSNAVNIVNDHVLVATGAGQMSRIDSVELALSKANTHGHILKGAVCASDAFFPFPDSVQKLAEAGISAIIAPGGAMRDGEVIECADRLGVSLLFAEDRHFRH